VLQRRYQGWYRAAVRLPSLRKSFAVENAEPTTCLFILLLALRLQHVCLFIHNIKEILKMFGMYKRFQPVFYILLLLTAHLMTSFINSTFKD